MLRAEANTLLVTDSSSEEDSETDDQSYPPRGACSNLAVFLRLVSVPARPQHALPQRWLRLPVHKYAVLKAPNFSTLTNT